MCAADGAGWVDLRYPSGESWSLVLRMGCALPGWERGGLVGRAGECALLDGLAGDVRRGVGRCLVVRGEAGIGKTALLEYLVAAAPDVVVVRAMGVESEVELAYASLHQLC